MTISSPAKRYAAFLSGFKTSEILDFGLQETLLVFAPRMARWLGISQCYLKVETSHPTGTMKDRIAEVTLSFLNSIGVKSYSHCSTGNTGTSLVWGLSRMDQPFNLEIFIPEAQLSHHNFENIPGLTTVLIKGAEYEDAKRYCSWYTKHVLHQPEYSSGKNSVRRSANKIAYLEAYEQLSKQGVTSLTHVCQAISDGTGIIGAELAMKDAIKEGWLSKEVSFVVAQPAAANPVVRCFGKGRSTYDPGCSLPQLGQSRAFAIRRKDASGYYEDLYSILKNGGCALSAEEDEIIAAKQALYTLEGIDAGYTACTVLAAIKKANETKETFKNAHMLIMITGKDRPTDITPRIDRVISKKEWQMTLS